MALIFMDGFDHYVLADWNKKWTSGAAPNTIAAARNGNGFTYYYQTQTIKNLGANYTTLIVGMAIKKSTSNNANSGTTDGILTFYDGASKQLVLRHEGSGVLAVRRGSGTLIETTIAPVIFSDRYTYIEFKATINDTTGSYEVRANGVAILSGSGVDTQNTTNAQINAIGIGGTVENSGGALTYIDDLYVCDTSGSVNNNFLGEVRIKTIFPTAEGTNTTWTPLSGTDNALMVDETAQDGDTTYNSTDTVSNRDTYVMQDIASLGSTIYGISVNTVARKEGDSPRAIKSTIKSGATYALGAERTLATGYVFYQDMHDQNPDGTVAWTEASVNAIEAGVDLTV